MVNEKSIKKGKWENYALNREKVVAAFLSSMPSSKLLLKVKEVFLGDGNEFNKI